jgi:ATP-dependent helicase HrpB
VTALPIDPLLPEIVRTLKSAGCLVIEAPPGAGKTTRVPPAILEAGHGDVLVLEPRRIAARLAARRVASERGESVGETVGYQVRFEQFSSARTRLRFMTEGVLTRRLLTDLRLKGVGAVVLDEFHERHLDGDLALAFLRRLQKTGRPDLKLVVMSATLDAAAIAAFLGDCPILRSEGRLFDLSVGYTPESPEAPEQRIAEALENLIREGVAGDVLVFLPGAAEIRKAMRACASIAKRAGLLLLPLHGDLPPEEQDLAVSPAGQPKVIFSTNVAESSITIEGVRAVIDTGLARVVSDSPFTGLPRIEVRRIGRASATQRAGRAGRTGPGRVIRLYTAEDFHRRPESDTPEITRRELTQLCLDLHAFGVSDPGGLDWLDAPPAVAVEAAENLLRLLRALDADHQLTPIGRRMAELPLHPRLARLVLDAGEEGCLAAALLAAGERLTAAPPHPSPSDLFLLMERRIEPHVRQMEQQIRRLARPQRQGKALQLALLAAFPDRVAARLRGTELRMANGSPAQLASSSGVVDAKFLVALDMEERPEQGAPLVRMASAIEPEWLLDLFPDRITESDMTAWDRIAGRAERVSSLRFEGLVIEETRGGEPDPEQAAELVALHSLTAGVERLVDADAWSAFQSRLEFAAAQGGVRLVTSQSIQEAVRVLATGLRTVAQLRDACADGGLERALLAQLGSDAEGRLERLAPARIRLPSGRQARVQYASGQAPWVASRLQDFFGLRETPRVAGGQVPLVVHLLAPNQRPVQTTTDLAGFWERLYPQLRRELSRRYPKHAWPENPYTASKE